MVLNRIRYIRICNDAIKRETSIRKEERNMSQSERGKSHFLQQTTALFNCKLN